MWPFQRKSAPPLTDPASESWAALTGLFAPGSTGVVVTADVAMSVPAVNAAVTLVAGTVGLLPCKLYSNGATGKQPAPEHAAYTLVHDDANAWQSAGKVRELITTDAMLHGDGFGFVVKVGNKPVEILHLARHAVTVERLDTGEPRYRIGQQVYGPDQVIHLQAPSIDGRTGYGLLRAGREAIGLAVLLERTSARLFKNNSRPGSVLSFKGSLKADTVKRIGEAWRAAHGGDNAGGVAVLDQAGEYKPIAFTSVETQHTEQRSFSIAEIARLTRVPVTMLQDLSHGTFANTEQQNLQFLQLCLLPWLKAWTDAYRRTLLTSDERQRYSVEFIVDDLLRADTAARASAYASFRAAGVMTSNDCRRLENLPALPDGDTLASPYTTAGTAPAKKEDAE